MDPWYAYREHPKKPLQLYDLENDPGCSTDVANDQPDTAQQMVRYLNEAHIDSEWYNNPGESPKVKQAKQRKAEQEGTVFISPRPNTRDPE